MRETLFELKGWELIRTEYETSNVFEKVHICHTKCDSYQYHTIRGVGSKCFCLVCEDKIPDEIVALWCLLQPNLL